MKHIAAQLSLLLVLVSLSLLPTRAAAQAIAGRVRLEARVQAVSLYYATNDVAGRDVGANVGGGSFGGLAGLSGIGGLSAAGIGYAIDDHWVPSLAGSISRTDDGPGSDRSSWSVEPSVSYVFSSGQSMRPFVTAGVGYGSSSLAGLASTIVGGTLRSGMQFHVVDHLSIEPYAQLQYAYSQQEGGNVGVTVAESVTHVVQLAGGFMIALWI